MQIGKIFRRPLLAAMSVAAALSWQSIATHAQDKPLNFVFIWGDDVGYWNISAYNQGMMGYETPNIDRIAKEGMLFTHAYGEFRYNANNRIK